MACGGGQGYERGALLVIGRFKILVWFWVLLCCMGSVARQFVEGRGGGEVARETGRWLRGGHIEVTNMRYRGEKGEGKREESFGWGGGGCGWAGGWEGRLWLDGGYVLTMS